GIALHFEVRQYLELGLEGQRFAVVHMEVGDAWLGDRMQSLFFSLLAEVARNELFDDFCLDVFGEALAHHRRGNLALAEAGQARHLLELGYDSIGLASDDVGGNRNADLALSRVGGWGGSFGFCHCVSLLFNSAAYRYAATSRI